MSMSDESLRFTIAFEPSNLAYEAPAGVPILRSAREAGLVLGSSCRNGTCRACLCRLASGSVRYAIEWPGLSAEEKAEGWILPCVAIPESALVLQAVKLVDRRGPAA